VSVAAEITQRVEAANREALRRMVAAQPVLVDVMLLDRFDPGLGGRMVTHAGPPVTPVRMAGGMRGAVMAAACYEGWVTDPAGGPLVGAIRGSDISVFVGVVASFLVLMRGRAERYEDRPVADP
jgi:hypothetical protein